MQLINITFVSQFHFVFRRLSTPLQGKSGNFCSYKQMADFITINLGKEVEHVVQCFPQGADSFVKQY